VEICVSVFSHLLVEISNSHSGEDVSVGLLGCDTMWTSERNILPPSSGIKMEAACSSKTLISTYKSTQHHNPENQHWDLYCYSR
jgi:hypothetical protein